MNFSTSLRQFYNTPETNAIALRYGFYVLSAVGLLVFIGLTALRVPAAPEPVPLSQWKVINIPEPAAQPLHTPTLLDDAVIWQRTGDDHLNYQHFSGAPTYHYDWIPGQVVRWDAQPRPDDLLVAWVDQDERLSVARLTTQGNQITAPIPVGRGSEFQLIWWQAARSLLVWRDHGSLLAAFIDEEGRPTLPALLRENVGLFAVNPAGQLIWQEGSSLYSGELDIASSLTLNSATHLLEFVTPPVALHLIETPAGAMAIWGSRVEPDIEAYGALLFAGESPQPITLTLPGNLPLRWLQPGHGAMLTAAVLIEQQWQPATLTVGAGGIENYTLLDEPAVTGSPISLHGQHLGWVMLDASLMPELHVITLDSHYGELRYPPRAQNWQAALRAGLQAAPYGLLWLIAPLLSFYFTAPTRWQLPLGLLLYVLGKSILSFGLWDQYPVTLLESEFTPLIALAGITLLALLIGFAGWGRAPVWVRYTVFCLTDLLFTFAIFGAGVQSLRL